MNTYIALLRGVNVGGHNKLPMRELAQTLSALGLRDVRTYIQSGNVVFRSEEVDPAALSRQITAAIEQSRGFAPGAIVLERDSLRAAMAANPFPEAEADHKSLHLFFLDDGPAHPDLEALEAVRAANERFALINRVFYLHAPDGVGRSKLAEKAGRGWGVAITARNWRTVSAIMALADD